MNGVEIAALILFSTALIIQLYFVLFLFVKVLKQPKNKSDSYAHFRHPVSVIIAAKNEAVNLKNNLPVVLSQNYPEFEVIVVLDQTIDNSETVLTELQKTNTNLIVLKNCESQQGKKNAITKAIYIAKHEHLLFTDADCCPAGDNWIREMTNFFSDEKSIILGLGMFNIKSSFINNFIRYDSQIIALQYSAAAITGRPYMGVGRNLAYTKKIWESNSGFEKHKEIMSGDDDLFVLSAGTKINTSVCTNSQSVTLSDSKPDFATFLRQKARHITSSSKYDLRAMFFSGAEIVSRSIMFLSMAVLLFNNLTPIFIGIYIFRTVALSFIVCNFSRKIKNPITIFNVIIFDIFAPIFYGRLLVYKLLIYKKKEW